MNVLLDTHFVIAVVDENLGRYGRASEDVLRGPRARLFVSVASLWEIAIKTRLGKLELRFDLARLASILDDAAVEVRPVLAAHVLTEAVPIPPTRDPFDRLLLAVCAVEGLRLLTIDGALLDHPLAVDLR